MNKKQMIQTLQTLISLFANDCRHSNAIQICTKSSLFLHEHERRTHNIDSE